MAAHSADAPLSRPEADRLLAPLAAAAGIGLAVSGGADSLALMRLAADWRHRLHPRLPMMVFTVDHALRPEAAAEAAQVAEWARAAGLEHATLVWEGAKPRADIAAAAREARYRLLVEACAAHGLSHLVTAHHRDDQAETLLMRLARGSGVDGLAAMPEASDWRGVVHLRPFLGTAKARLGATLARFGQTWIEDPSNRDDRFARSRIRALMPDLAKEGLASQRLAETARRMRRARAALESAAADLHRAVVREDPAGFCRIDREAWSSAPEELGLRVLARLLMGIGGTDYPPRLERLERLYGDLTCETEAPAAATLNGCRVVRSPETVLVLREAGRVGLPVVSLDAAPGVVWDRRFRIDRAGAPAKGLTVRALGADGVAVVRRTSELRAIPVVAARVAPAVFLGETLLAAPLVEARPGPYSGAEFTFSFVGAARFA
ncbi:tRNA lysidine(34) synthetase TilS [Microbaculum marinum]|uniref:tRNA(Ile)-lysidine synthase n=1 Tax=Microbaculum marinum TaxID=1764581 RepID=A0AAW9RXI3_9HYPH